MCAKLGIALIHARPYQPAGKGKIERFFRTLRAAWLSHLGDEDTKSLEALNRSLWAWVEGEYHCCFSESVVGSPRQLVAVFRSRIYWKDGAIR